MRGSFHLFLAAAALLVVAVARADDPTVSLEGVHDLTPDNFDKLIKGDKHALVEFYAPWCGHCKRMVNDYKAVGEAVLGDAGLKSRVVIAKVNADEHRSLGERFGVQGFPTIKYFARGKPVDKDGAQDYAGARTSDKFLEFLKQKLEDDKGFARVEELASVVKDFVAGKDKAAKTKVVAAAEAAVKKLSGDAQKHGEIYVKMMKKALDKGDAFFAKEAGRLERMISSGGVAAAKVDDFARKASVLSAFTEAAGTATE